MIVYTTGDLLTSATDALVNTVNCEGYMGKGIAYQFKLKYPENNIDYVKALIEKKLIVLSDDVEIYVYEPSQSYIAQLTEEPKLSY